MTAPPEPVTPPAVPAVTDLNACTRCGGTGWEPLTATDVETLTTLGHAIATVADVAQALGIKHTTASERLSRLVARGKVVRYEQAGTRAALYEANDPSGRAHAMDAALSRELPPAEMAWWREAVIAIQVVVTGRRVTVMPQPGWTIGAIATDARWKTGDGPVPSGNWEIRDEQGALLDPHAPPGHLRVLYVNRLAGIGG